MWAIVTYLGIYVERRGARKGAYTHDDTMMDHSVPANLPFPICFFSTSIFSLNSKQGIDEMENQIAWNSYTG